MDCPEPAALCGVCSLNNPGTALCRVSVMIEKDVSDPNPKIDPAPYSNTEKEPDDWVSGNDPMTGAQASYLKTLSEECDESESFQADRSVQTHRRAQGNAKLSAPPLAL